MSKRLFTLVFIFLMVIITVLNAAAQSQLSETYISQDGTFIVRYPEGWTLDEYDGGYFYISAYDLTDSEGNAIFVDMSFVLPDLLATDFPDLSPDESILEAMMDIYGGTEVETFSLRNRRAVRITFSQDEEYTDMMYLFELSDGRTVGVYVYVGGDFQEVEQTIVDILASFDYAPPGAAGTRRTLAPTRTAPFPTGTLVFSSNSTLPPPPPFATATVTPTPAFPSPTVVFGQGGSSEVCSVSVSQPRSATVRSGPSAIRPAVLFLPENRSFTVTGSSTAADGTVWYRLDKQEVAPDKSAKELWVSAAQVSARNC
jgi:hypothetical protein